MSHMRRSSSGDSLSSAPSPPQSTYASPRVANTPLPVSPYHAPSPLLPYGLASPSPLLTSPLGSPASPAWDLHQARTASPLTVGSPSYFPPFEPVPSGPPSPPLDLAGEPILLPSSAPALGLAAGLKITIPAADEPVPEPSPNPESNPDNFMDDESLSSLERIYLYSRSNAGFQRVFIVHALPRMLEEITPSEAVDYVLPLLNNLAVDDEDQVQEALASELLPLVWWFVTKCTLVPDDPPEGSHDPPLLSSGLFTPLFGTLLLSHCAATGMHTRQAIVDLLKRLREVEADEYTLPLGCFGPSERQLFEREILDQVVIAIGNLDAANAVPTSPIDAAVRGLANASSPTLSDTGAATSTLNANDFPPLTRQNYTQPRSTFEPPSDRSMLVAIPPVSPPPVPGGVIPVINPFSAPGLFSAEHDDDRNIRHERGGTDAGESSPAANSDGGWFGAAVQELDTGADELGEQVIMGRISRMSLMAALTANGSVSDKTRQSFLSHVQSGSRDPVFWVRREAAFALGALAKVLPDELVTSLIPICQGLCQDTVWHVRHSAVFALPAVLSRLTPAHRRTLALSTMLPFVTDESAAVRLGVTEVLGEVIYTFHGDPLGPPDQIIRLFVGRPEDRARDPYEPHRWFGDALRSPRLVNGIPLSPLVRIPFEQSQRSPDPEDPFFRDAERSLICAFNFPAVALSVGRSQWKQLRELYLFLLDDPSPRVRKTLAASIGELSKIIGPQAAGADLLPAWLTASRHDEPQVRLKAAECVELLVVGLEPPKRTELVDALVDIRERNFTGWREREALVKSIAVVASSSPGSAQSVRALLKASMLDEAASVRQAAVTLLPEVLLVYKDQRKVLDGISDDLQLLAEGTSFRRRGTFISCLQALSAPESKTALPLVSDSLWGFLRPMCRDPVVDVRIRLTRLLSAIGGRPDIPLVIEQLVDQLRDDPSPDVRAFIPEHLRQPGPVVSRTSPLTPSSARSKGSDSRGTGTSESPIARKTRQP